LFHNAGVSAADTWRVNPRFTLTYGVRWDVDAVPSTASGASLLRTWVWRLLEHRRSRPRIPILRLGSAWHTSSPSQSPAWQRVVRGGFGLFYDHATSEVGNTIIMQGYPFSSGQANVFGGPFPLPSSQAQPPPITGCQSCQRRGVWRLQLVREGSLDRSRPQGPAFLMKITERTIGSLEGRLLPANMGPHPREACPERLGRRSATDRTGGRLENDSQRGKEWQR